MWIQLEEFQGGKPITLKKNEEHLVEIIKALQQAKAYRQILEVAQKMSEGEQKYLIATNSLLQLKDWNQLLIFCELALKTFNHSEFHYLKGKALGKMGKNLEKIQSLRKAIKMNWEVAGYHRNLGAALYAERRYQEAIQFQENAVKLQPGNAMNYHNLGVSLFRMGKYQEACKQFDKSLSLNGKYDISLSWKGDCLKFLKKFEDARKCYMEAYTINPNPVYLRQKQKLEDYLSNIGVN